MREKLIELICHAKRDDPETGSFTDYLADYLIAHGVTIREKGEWQHVKVRYATPGGDPVVGCPFCDNRESYHVNGIEVHHEWNFCPNCGADMRGEEE